MAKILMITGDFTEDYETMVPFQALLMVGHTVHAVCPGKKAGEQVKTAVHDFEGDQTYTEKYGHNYVLSKSFSAAKPADYDAVYIAGGRGPEYIRIDKRVQAIVRQRTKLDTAAMANELSRQLRGVTDEFLTKANRDRPEHLEAILAPSIVPTE